MFRHLFNRDSILATILVFVIMGLLSMIPVNAEFLDPIKLALQDFDYNDLAYSQFQKNAHTAVDTNIVIVNISDADRSEIAAITEAVGRQGPAVIGLDVLFNEPRDSATDAMLLAVINKYAVVLAYDLNTDNKSAVPIGFLYPRARKKGFANFVGEEAGVIRHFAPSFEGNEDLFPSFPVSIAEVAYPKQYNNLISRNKAAVEINYCRTRDKFIVLDVRDLLQAAESSTFLANKTVLVGFVATDPNSIEDKHFTPFNKKSVGRSVPDMEGIFIHANILSMMRDNSYIKQPPVWINWLIASLLCWFHMALFIRYDQYLWFHPAAKIAQLISAVLFVYIGLLLYYKWNIKIELAPTFLAIILAVDILYFYEAFMAWLHRKFGIYSVFVNKHL